MLGHIENELSQLAVRVENLERCARRQDDSPAGYRRDAAGNITVPAGLVATKREVADVAKALSDLARIVKRLNKSVEELSVGQDALIDMSD